MTKLSKYEKETIINWNEAEDTASIYTFNADLKRRLAEFSRKYPQLCRLERSTPEGSVTYVMDKSRMSIRLVPPYSEERLVIGIFKGIYTINSKTVHKMFNYDLFVLRNAREIHKFIPLAQNFVKTVKLHALAFTWGISYFF